MPSRPSASLDAAAFTVLAERFADASRSRSPSWAFICAPIASNASLSFAPMPTGYLKASPVLLPSLSPVNQPAVDEDDQMIDDDTVANPPPPCRLELHIVHSDTYRVPVLLLQGYHANGALWTPDELRGYLCEQAKNRGLDSSGVLPLSVSQVSQMEHPILRMPVCCIDPCETASLMGCLLHQGGNGDFLSSRPKNDANAGTEGDGNAIWQQQQQIDYLTAWWSVVSPLVGVENRAVWVCPPDSGQGSSLLESRSRRPPGRATAS